jgi:phosphoglycerate dehydrogenase-like enzyme
MKVLIAPMTLANLDNPPFLRILLDAGFDPVYPTKPQQMTEDELLEALQGVSASLAGSEPYTRRVLAAHPQLRVIARAGVGYDAVDVQAATDHGMVVTITPDTNQEAVAEHTFALILALAKEVIPHHLAVKAGQWPRKSNLPLRGRALGIAGLGRIGKAVAIRGAAFGMKLLAYEPFPDHEFVKKYGVKLLSFEDLLRESDWLSLHVPLSAESRHLINKKTLALMKPTAYLINTARGGLVCEPDLVDALRTKKIAGAGLDVLDAEPPGPHALFELDNVVLTPHTAGVDQQSRDDMAVSAAEAIVSLYRGEWPEKKIVNPAVRATFRW